MEEFERAKDKIMMGAERRSMVMTEEEKRNTAYHESGHAIVGLSVPEHDPVYKVTIIPRGRALGRHHVPAGTGSLQHEQAPAREPHRDAVRRPRRRGAGVRAGCGHHRAPRTTSSAPPSSPATWSPRWGLSDRLGPQTYSEESGEVFLGRSVTQHKQVSDVTAHAIDEEVRRVIDSNYQRALQDHLRPTWTSCRPCPRR